MKKYFAVLFILLFVAVMLNATVLGAAPVKVRICGYGGTDLSLVEEMINTFVNPALKSEGITAVYEPVADDYNRVLTNALSSGTAADVFYTPLESITPLIASGTLEPLDSYISKSKVLKKQDIIPSLMDAFTQDGKVYGIAKDFNTLALIYNKDLFDRAGVAYPDEKDTWTTLEAKLAKVSDPANGVYGLALPPQYERLGALAFGAGFLPFGKKGKSNIADPGFKAALEWYAGLAKKGYGIQPADIGQGWGGGAFATEKVAVCIEGAWVVGFLKDTAPNLNYGATYMPKNPQTGKRGNFLYSVAWSMYKNSKVKKAAFRVLESLTSPEVQQWILERGLAIPSRAALANNKFFQKKTADALTNYIVFKGASDGVVIPFAFQKYGRDWSTAVDEGIRAVMSNQSTVDQALAEVQEKLNQIMK